MAVLVRILELEKKLFLNLLMVCLPIIWRTCAGGFMLFGILGTKEKEEFLTSNILHIS